MTHLSTSKSIMAMVFYSLITFFIAPYLTSPLLKEHPDKCIFGFLVGFTVSIFLWMKFRKSLAN